MGKVYCEQSSEISELFVLFWNCLVNYTDHRQTINGDYPIFTQL